MFALKDRLHFLMLHFLIIFATVTVTDEPSSLEDVTLDDFKCFVIMLLLFVKRLLQHVTKLNVVGAL